MHLRLFSCFGREHNVLAWMFVVTVSCTIAFQSSLGSPALMWNLQLLQRTNNKVEKIKPAVMACSTQLATEPRVEERVLPVHTNTAFPLVAPA